jgi:hypothetical protein
MGVSNVRCRGRIDMHMAKFGHEKLITEFHGGPDKNFKNRHF